MLSRDFVYAFLLGQVENGLSEQQAKDNFQLWLNKQTEAIVVQTEKDAIVADLTSYTIKM